MTCTEIRAQLAAYHEGGLRPQQRHAVAVHLTSCPDCEAELAAFEAGAKGASSVCCPDAQRNDLRLGSSAFSRRGRCTSAAQSPPAALCNDVVQCGRHCGCYRRHRHRACRAGPELGRGTWARLFHGTAGRRARGPGRVLPRLAIGKIGGLQEAQV